MAEPNDIIPSSATGGPPASTMVFNPAPTPAPAPAAAPTPAVPASVTALAQQDPAVAAYLNALNAANPTPVTSTGTDALGLPTVPGAAGAALLPNLPPNATDAQIESAAMTQYNASPALQQYIQQTYGYIGTYLLSQPELLPILVAAGLDQWDEGRFDAAVVNTNWWKTSSQAVRNFQEIQSTNPGEAAAQVSQMQSTILTHAQSLGVTIPASDLKQIATMAVQWGWSADVIDQTLRVAGSTGTAGGTQSSTAFGQTATFAQDAKTLAGQYNINLSDSQLQSYVNQNLAGTLDAKGLQAIFEQQATQQNPWMAASIKMGVTPSQYLSSYASAAASTLGIDPSDVNWTDPKWSSALLQTNKDGTQTPVSVGVFQQNLMKNPTYGYQYTTNARDQAYGVAQTIEQTFGKIK